MKKIAANKNYKMASNPDGKAHLMSHFELVERLLDMFEKVTIEEVLPDMSRSELISLYDAVDDYTIDTTGQ